MCTRYFVEKQYEQMNRYILDAEESPLFQRFVDNGITKLSSGEIRPTDAVPVIASDRRGKPSVFPMKWGFRIPLRQLIVNARVETAMVKPSFRDSWKEHRCIIPASYYFEWKHFKDPEGKIITGAKCAIHPDSDNMLWMCGLYRIEDGLPVFVVLTKEATNAVVSIHDRMPVMLSEKDINRWISPGITAESMLDNIVDKVTVSELTQ